VNSPFSLLKRNDQDVVGLINACDSLKTYRAGAKQRSIFK